MRSTASAKQKAFRDKETRDRYKRHPFGWHLCFVGVYRENQKRVSAGSAEQDDSRDKGKELLFIQI